VVVGGDPGDISFQFGALLSVELIDGRIIDFEVSVCEVICQKNTAKLIERTILPQQTNGLEVVKTIPLCISANDDGKLIFGFNRTPSTGSTTPIVDVYLTGNLAFQAMALEKESMAGRWCSSVPLPKPSSWMTQCCGQWRSWLA
jgi:hypothetical protein